MDIPFETVGRELECFVGTMCPHQSMIRNHTFNDRQLFASRFIWTHSIISYVCNSITNAHTHIRLHRMYVTILKSINSNSYRTCSRIRIIDYNCRSGTYKALRVRRVVVKVHLLLTFNKRVCTHRSCISSDPFREINAIVSDRRPSKPMRKLSHMWVHKSLLFTGGEEIV